MEKIYKTDWYYIRNADLKVIPVGMFPETIEGSHAACDAADTHAAGSNHTALVYLSATDLIDLMDDLQRAFDATHPYDEEQTNDHDVSSTS